VIFLFQLISTKDMKQENKKQLRELEIGHQFFSCIVCITTTCNFLENIS